MVPPDPTGIYGMEFYRIILDEAHTIKNPRSQGMFIHSYLLGQH